MTCGGGCGGGGGGGGGDAGDGGGSGGGPGDGGLALVDWPSCWLPTGLLLFTRQKSCDAEKEPGRCVNKARRRLPLTTSLVRRHLLLSTVTCCSSPLNTPLLSCLAQCF